MGYISNVLPRLNHGQDLIRVLSTLMAAQERRRLGAVGATRMKREFGWRELIARRLTDCEASLS
jgi:hypothetical protein